MVMSNVSTLQQRALQSQSLSKHQKLAKLGFHGSYRAEDIVFLLHKSQLQPIEIIEKERLIQSGQRHYSQMIGPEVAPSAQHWQHYHEAMRLGAKRMAFGCKTYGI